jgi:hypothetical protein
MIFLELHPGAIAYDVQTVARLAVPSSAGSAASMGD